MNQWELRSVVPSDMSLIRGSDPFKEHLYTGYDPDDDEYSMVMDQGKDTPAIRYFTTLVRTQINCAEYANSQKIDRCIFGILGCVIKRPDSFMVPLILDIEHRTNPYVMIVVCELFTDTGYDIDVYWNVMPNQALLFNAGEVSPLTDNLLSVERMYASSCTSEYGGVAKHYIYPRNRRWISDYSYKREKGTRSTCLIQ